MISLRVLRHTGSAKEYEHFSVRKGCIGNIVESQGYDHELPLPLYLTPRRTGCMSRDPIQLSTAVSE